MASTLCFPGDLSRSRDGLTQALRLGAAPESVRQALPHVGAHQGVARVAREDGRGPKHGQSPDLVAVAGKGQASAGDDCKANRNGVTPSAHRVA